MPLPLTTTNQHRGVSAHMHPGKLDVSYAADLGEQLDVIAENTSKWNGQQAALRSLNADLLRLTYVNAMFAQATQGGTFPAAWYMKNGAGSKLVSKGYGNYLMEPRRAAAYTDVNGTYTDWSDFVVQNADRLSVDGVFLDMQGPAPMLAGYLKPYGGGGTAVPRNYQTGKDFGIGSYLAVAHDVAAAVRDFGTYVVANGIGNGQQFYKTPTRRLLDSVDVGYAEVWMRTPVQAHDAFPGEASWLQEVQAVVDAQLVDLGAIWTCTKFWRTRAQTGLSTTDYDAAVAQWRRLAYCSHLLADREASIFEYSPLESNAPNADDDDYYHVDLGAPAGQPALITGMKSGGAYRRRYANGWVYVNPTGSQVTVNSSPDGRSYVQPGSGADVNFPVNLRANTGRIIVISGFETGIP